MITMKDIAQLAGVSRGTVDRVLNNRGEVHPDTAKRIREIAAEMKYTPNIAGKTLAVKKKQLSFGYILFGSTASNPFFLDIVRGIESKSQELQEFGVSVKTCFTPIDDPPAQAKLIESLVDEGIDGLAISPFNHPAVVEKLKSLTQSGFPVVTANSDIPDCGRLAYVGCDYYKSGETAAGIMNLACGGNANTGIVIGSPLILGHSERVSGFSDNVKKSYPGIKVIEQVINYDDDHISFDVTRDLLSRHPEIDALFLAAAGVSGACRAVEEMGLKGKIKIVGYDVPESTKEFIRSGTILATIAQQPFTQGAKPLDILMDYLGLGIKPEKEFFYTKLEIKIRENL